MLNSERKSDRMSWSYGNEKARERDHEIHTESAQIVKQKMRER